MVRSRQSSRAAAPLLRRVPPPLYTPDADPAPASYRLDADVPPPSRCQALMNTIKEEDLVENMSISKEIGFRICDKLTRKTRQLIKMISVVDMAK